MQAKQQAYLEAMGIPVWQLRDRPAGEVRSPEVHLGPGTGEVLLLVCSADESAGKLSSDIARALRSEPVWGWPTEAESAPALEESVAERLFTHILVFGAEAERAIFGGPAPELMGSAAVVRVPAMGDIGLTPAKRRKLWATLCQHRLAGARKPPGDG